MKFYERTWFVIIMLIFFFPLGLFLMWKFKDWTKGVKWIVTVVVVLVAIFGFATDENDGEEKKQETNTTTDSKEDSKDSKEDKKDNAEKYNSKNDTKTKEEKQKSEIKKDDKPLTDKEKLDKKLKDDVSSADIKGVEFGNGPSDVTIKLDGKSAMSDKSTTRGFKMATAEALLALKESKINVNNADIYVYHDLNDGMKDEEKMVMSSRWDKETIDEMNEDALYTLPDHIEAQAESSYMHPVMRKNDK